MGIAYRSTLGEPPTGNAVVGDVLYGKTFSNADGTDKVGTMPNNGAVAPTALDPGGSYTIPAGYHNGQGAVSAKSNTATYTANTRGAALDMGAANLNRYVNTNGVPNSNSGTYTFPANDTGGTKDLGEANSYRYVNAQNVYNKGKADGSSSAKNIFTITAGSLATQTSILIYNSTGLSSASWGTAGAHTYTVGNFTLAATVLGGYILQNLTFKSTVAGTLYNWNGTIKASVAANQTVTLESSTSTTYTFNYYFIPS